MKRVAIMGGGLAGTACAYMLKSHGLQPVIYEAGPHLAPGASGNALGLYNPRLSAHRTAESDYYAGAFALALRILPALHDIGWRPCGNLHLITDEKREKRFAQTLKNWGWDSPRMRLVDSAEASRIAGVGLNHAALFLSDAGCVSPQKLCAAYAQGVETHFNARIESLAGLKADAFILACGPGVTGFAQSAGLPLQAVRGQITQVRAAPASRALECNLCYGGYFTPAFNGLHMLGATFQRWLDHGEIREEDDARNIAALAAVAPALAEGLEVTNHRAGVRMASKDHFPVAGRLSENIYISAAHGSHGILSTLAAAQMIACMIAGAPLPLPRTTITALSPARF